MWMVIYFFCSALWMAAELLLKIKENSLSGFGSLKASYVNWFFSNLIFFLYVRQLYKLETEESIIDEIKEMQSKLYPFETAEFMAYNDFELVFYLLLPVVAFYVLYLLNNYKVKASENEIAK